MIIPGQSNLDGGLYVGPAGIAYALWKISTFLEPTDSKPILEYAEHLMKLNLQYVQNPERQRDKKNKVGFLLGTYIFAVKKYYFRGSIIYFIEGRSPSRFKMEIGGFAFSRCLNGIIEGSAPLRLGKAKALVS